MDVVATDAPVDETPAPPEGSEAIEPPKARIIHVPSPTKRGARAPPPPAAIAEPPHPAPSVGSTGKAARKPTEKQLAALQAARTRRANAKQAELEAAITQATAGLREQLDALKSSIDGSALARKTVRDGSAPPEPAGDDSAEPEPEPEPQPPAAPPATVPAPSAQDMGHTGTGAIPRSHRKDILYIPPAGGVQQQPAQPPQGALPPDRPAVGNRMNMAPFEHPYQQLYDEYDDDFGPPSPELPRRPPKKKSKVRLHVQESDESSSSDDEPTIVIRRRRRRRKDGGRLPPEPEPSRPAAPPPEPTDDEIYAMRRAAIREAHRGVRVDGRESGQGQIPLPDSYGHTSLPRIRY